MKLHKALLMLGLALSLALTPIAFSPALAQDDDPELTQTLVLENEDGDAVLHLFVPEDWVTERDFEAGGRVFFGSNEAALALSIDSTPLLDGAATPGVGGGIVIFDASTLALFGAENADALLIYDIVGGVFADTGFVLGEAEDFAVEGYASGAKGSLTFNDVEIAFYVLFDGTDAVLITAITDTDFELMDAIIQTIRPDAPEAVDGPTFTFDVNSGTGDIQLQVTTPLGWDGTQDEIGAIYLASNPNELPVALTVDLGSGIEVPLEDVILSMSLLPTAFFLESDEDVTADSAFAFIQLAFADVAELSDGEPFAVDGFEGGVFGTFSTDFNDGAVYLLLSGDSVLLIIALGNGDLSVADGIVASLSIE